MAARAALRLSMPTVSACRPATLRSSSTTGMPAAIDAVEVRPVPTVGRAHDEAVHPSLGHHPDGRLLLVELLVGVGEQHLEALGAGGVGDAAQRAPEERVLDVGHDDAEGAGRAGDHAPREAVGAVAELLRGGQHALARALAHGAVAAERPGRRGRRDPRLARDVVDRRDAARVDAPAAHGAPLRRLVLLGSRPDPSRCRAGALDGSDQFPGDPLTVSHEKLRTFSLIGLRTFSIPVHH